MKRLNDSELKVMQILWKLKKAFLKDIVEEYEEPKPAYTTVSTIVNRMQQKGYVAFERLGRDKEYYPVLEKKSYLGTQIKQTVKDFFNDSPAQFASFFTQNADLSTDELKELQDMIQTQLKNKTNDDD